jgi:hypothetical protein
MKYYYYYSFNVCFSALAGQSFSPRCYISTSILLQRYASSGQKRCKLLELEFASLLTRRGIPLKKKGRV